MNHSHADAISVAQAARQALAALEGGTPVALVTIVQAPLEDAVGRRLVVAADEVTGTLGSAELDRRAAELACEALAARACGIRELELNGETWAFYVESQYAAPELLIVGAGHVGQALSRFGATLGFRVTVIDDRPEFANRERFPEATRVQVVSYEDPFRDVVVGADSYVVLVTRGHKYDYDSILQLLRREARPAYLGMIGSRRRVRATFEALVRDGVDPARLAQVHAPIGLDIGAETPEEIALAIAAELVAVRRGGSGGALGGKERVLDRVAPARETEQGGK
ncbi:MAG: XdhC family protein [Gemmatimonadota bacterium]|nr:MAG: XdhC family protein [Gemmatimonadota bacterium]